MSVSGFVGDGKSGQVWNKTGNIVFPTLSQKRKSGRNTVDVQIQRVVASLYIKGQCTRDGVWPNALC